MFYLDEQLAYIDWFLAFRVYPRRHIRLLLVRDISLVATKINGFTKINAFVLNPALHFEGYMERKKSLKPGQEIVLFFKLVVNITL